MPTSPPSITALPTPPDPNDRPTFNARAYPWSVAQQTLATQLAAVASNAYNNAVEAAASAALAARASGTAMAYTFDAVTTDSDPGTGKLRLDNATQNAATTARMDLADVNGIDLTALLANLVSGTSTIKAKLRLQHATDATKFLVFDVTAAASPTGYRNVTIACVAYSTANPFTAGDPLAVSFSRVGDKGDTGATGAAGANGTNGAPGVTAVTRSARTSNTILGTADNGTLVDITSGTFTQTFTAVATLGSGWWCYIRNSGTGDVTLDPNAAETIDGLTSYAMYPGEVRLVQCDGVALRTVVVQAGYKAFTTSGTWTTPPGYSFFEGVAWGAGGGGGNNSGVTGNGGGGAACVPFKLKSSALAATVTVTIAAASAAQAAGGNSTFGTLVTAFGGGGGSTATYGGGGGSGVLGLASGTTGGSPRTGATDQSFGGGDASNPGWSSVYGGGAGGIVAGAGGASLYGGGGGGSTNGSAAGAGGVSTFGGSGGAAVMGNTGTAGTAPGGGGGGSSTGSGGAGARGEIRIWGVV